MTARPFTTAVSAVMACMAAVMPAAAQSESRVGVILMHGVGGTPKLVAQLEGPLTRAGAIVATPMMPWARGRDFDKSYEDSMAEIDGIVAQLRRKGATRIVVGGHSIGAAAALGYAARHDDVAGLLLLAPGHTPELAGFARRLSQSISKAHDLVKAGKGAARSHFENLNQGRANRIRTSADIYLTWFDSRGPASMAKNALNVSGEPAVLCADGKKEPRPRCSYIAKLLPRGITVKTENLDATHMGVVGASRLLVVDWIKGL